MSTESKIPENHPFKRLLTDLVVGDKTYKYFSLEKLNDPRVAHLPVSVKVLLESAIRNCDNFAVTEADVERILDWATQATQSVEIPYVPARVIMQDFTGVPAVVDLAAMRDAVERLGGDATTINPLVPVTLVIDHSVQVDAYRTADAVQRNLEIEAERNKERFVFLKWGSKAFNNMDIVPPGKAIVHQYNLERAVRGVFEQDGVLYPDSLVGTDSHSTMSACAGVLSWGVGGIEAEATMLGQPISMVLPEVVGFRLSGQLPVGTTATDLVLKITQMLRKKGVVGKFVEFVCAPGTDLPLTTRAVISNMTPETGATCCFFTVDDATLTYLAQTDRSAEQIAAIKAYYEAQKMYGEDAARQFTGDVMELDLTTIVPAVAGPKRPHDFVAVSALREDFRKGLTAPVSFKGYGLEEKQVESKAEFQFQGATHTLAHGSVVLAAITSCTNTSNPSLMLAAGLLAKRAVARGLNTKPYIKTSLAPGSQVVSRYLEHSGLQPFLDQLGFSTVAFGCTSCIGNSGEIPAEVSAAIEQADLVAAAVLSGNRNFEGRVHPFTRANYLASPPLVVAYAIAGTVDFDFETQPLGVDGEGKPVFLREIWPSDAEVAEFNDKHVLPSMFREVYANTEGDSLWRSLQVEQSVRYPWSEESTYIHHPPFFQAMGTEPAPLSNIDGAYVLLNLGDSITTDHISPAGNISRTSPAARFLIERGVQVKDFNTYGARRGHDEVMARGTFANPRLVNKHLTKPSANTLHVPSGEEGAIYDVAMRYRAAGQPTIIVAGREYGSGSSRDWAAKGPYMQGVKAVIAISYERIHRSNLVGMGILPLEFLPGQDLDTLGLTGKEQFSMDLTSAPLTVGQTIAVKASNGVTFEVRSRLDTAVELEYFRHGGILHYVIRKKLAEGKQ